MIKIQIPRTILQPHYQVFQLPARENCGKSFKCIRFLYKSISFSNSKKKIKLSLSTTTEIIKKETVEKKYYMLLSSFNVSYKKKKKKKKNQCTNSKFHTSLIIAFSMHSKQFCKWIFFYFILYIFLFILNNWNIKLLYLNDAKSPLVLCIL